MIKEFLKTEFNEYLENLENLVNIDCPSDFKGGTDKVRKYIIEKIEEIAGDSKNYKIEIFKEEKIGDHLLITRKGEKKGKILILAHMDTVFPIGTVKERKFKIEDKRAFGPGVSDMKHGICSIISALKALDFLKISSKTIQILFNSDEEIGSENSRKYIEKYAKDSDYVLVMESGGENGEVITSRKGIARYVLKVYGQAAHSGAEFEKGKNAILELSRKILEISKLIDIKAGKTINVGIIKGGDAVNIIPDYAEAILDVRCIKEKDMYILEKQIKESFMSESIDYSYEILGGINRPPLEENEVNFELYKKYKNISEECGLICEKLSSGGGTDGNFTSSLGIPTLDGIAPIGGRAHSSEEYLELDSIIPKTEIFIKLLNVL